MFISDWEHEKNALLLEDLQELKAEVASLNSSYDQCKKVKDTYLDKWSDESIEANALILKLKERLASLHDCHKVVKNQRDDSMRVAAELKTELAYLLGKDTRNSQQIAELKTANLSLKTDYQLYLKMNPSTI